MTKTTRILALCFIIVTITTRQLFAQETGTMPELIEKNGRHAFLVDGKPFFILGGQAHNSSNWPGMLPQVWTAVEVMHLNTVEIPIYWEQVEAQPGKFNFSMIDTLLNQSRQHKVHLVLLWFGTWKNGSNHYMPGWMKRNAAIYPNITGQKGQPVDSPSPVIKATLEADIKAFTAVMRHLKQADRQHTVIMVQVENESGAWDSERDYSPVAQKLFEGAVPAALLKPAVLEALNVPAGSAGTWKTVFGARSDEYFQAWSVARFVGQVAAAGKEEYPLPLYVNAALRDPLTNPTANNYESGGPTDNVIPIWKAAAPAIDLLAPDIYLTGSEKVLKVLDLYDRSDNSLFVPEAGLNPENAKYLYGVLAHGGIGFSPFGIDANGSGETIAGTKERLEPFAQEYAMAGPMMRELAEWAFEGKIKAVVEHENHADQFIDLGLWKAIVSFGGARRDTAQAKKVTTGKMMIVQVDENKFILIGSRCHITFMPSSKNEGKAWQYLKVEEGKYEQGSFKPLRILNGDETDFGGPRFGDLPTVLQASLIIR